MAPIATYSEIRFDGKRNFELFPDRIVVRGSTTLKSDFEITLPLVSLRSEPGRMSVRVGGFLGTIWVAAFSAAAVLIMHEKFSFSFLDWEIWIPICIGIIALFAMIPTIRRIEYAVFHSDIGVAALDIAKSGKQTSQFSAFVESLRAQIQKAKGQTGQQAAPPEKTSASLPISEASPGTVPGVDSNRTADI